VLRKAVCNAERLLGSAIWGSARGWHTSQYAILADHLKSEAAKQPGNLAFTIHAVRCDVTSGGRDIFACGVLTDSADSGGRTSRLDWLGPVRSRRGG
jgi:hypothetical protein